MKILIIPVHFILAYDETRFFERLGHQVYTLNLYGDRFYGGLRPQLESTDWKDQMTNKFNETGCKNTTDDPALFLLERKFLDNFDIILVHHNFRFIERHWNILRGRNLIWRTIGQELHWAEEAMRPYRKNVKIVRWSPAEMSIKSYIGHDAIIRAVKFEEDWAGAWCGKTKEVLTFSNHMTSRPEALNADFYSRVISIFPRKLYGLGNEIIPWNHGLIGYDEQRDALKEHRCFFTTGTWPAPYTLGFVEAWMSGIPVVHVGRSVWGPSGEQCFEVDILLENKKDGFCVNTVKECQYVLDLLLNDWDLSKSISLNGEKNAIMTFGFEKAKKSWNDFFKNSGFS